MNPLKKAYCRIFQNVFKFALPLLPYRNPKIIGSVKGIPEVLEKSRRCRRRSRMGGAGRRRHGTGQGRGRSPAGLPQGPEALLLHPRHRLYAAGLPAGGPV